MWFGVSDDEWSLQCQECGWSAEGSGGETEMNEASTAHWLEVHPVAYAFQRSYAVRVLLLDLLREHVLAEVEIEGEDIHAEGQYQNDGEMRTASLTVRGSAIETSISTHNDPEAAAGALLSDVEEQLHSAALEARGPLTVVIS